eukprot:763822-Hanusia_phi.AAC.2
MTSRQLASRVYRNNLDEVILGSTGQLTSIGSGPEEQGIEASNTELESGNSERETCSPPCRLERQLVGDVI